MASNTHSVLIGYIMWIFVSLALPMGVMSADQRDDERKRRAISSETDRRSVRHARAPIANTSKAIPTTRSPGFSSIT